MAAPLRCPTAGIVRAPLWLIWAVAIAALAPAPGLAQSPDQFDLLSYNVFMRPTTLHADGQWERAAIMSGPSGVLSGYDAIVFQEAFDDDVREVLLRGLTEYPYRTAKLGSDGILDQDGGVIIISRWPILAEGQRIFPSCQGWDCHAEKGVLYALINKQGRCYHIFGSHTQADEEPWRVRNEQFGVIKDFINFHSIRSDEPVLIAGDLNVDFYDGERFPEMLDLLAAGMPRSVGELHTFNGPVNDLNDPSEEHNQLYLDYVLYSRDHLHPHQPSAQNTVKVFRTSVPWDGQHRDLSDHYAVHGHFYFAPTPGLPCPSEGAFRGLYIEGPDVVTPGETYWLTAKTLGGGPNWDYRWSNGATSRSVSGVGRDPSQGGEVWSVEVTDLRDGMMRRIAHRVSGEDPEARARCLEICDEDRRYCEQEEPPRVGGCGRPYDACARRCYERF